MSRFFAVVDAPGDTERQFRDALSTMRKWRFDKRGWVIRALCNARDGKIYVDVESATRARFEAWLADTGWRAVRIDEIDLVFEESLLWPMRAPATR